MIRPGPEAGSRRDRIAELRRQARHRYQWWSPVRITIGFLAINQAVAAALTVAVGILHRQWWHAVPALHYDTAVSVVSVLTLAVLAVCAIYSFLLKA